MFLLLFTHTLFICGLRDSMIIQMIRVPFVHLGATSFLTLLLHNNPQRKTWYRISGLKETHDKKQCLHHSQAVWFRGIGLTSLSLCYFLCKVYLLVFLWTVNKIVCSTLVQCLISRKCSINGSLYYRYMKPINETGQAEKDMNIKTKCHPWR